MIEFDCEVCGKHVRKSWSASMPGRPRFCSLACKGMRHRGTKPVTREWMEAKYVTEGLDCTKIGKLVERDPKTVWSWLKGFGIPTRPRGGATAPSSFKPGQVSAFKGHEHTPETKERTRQLCLATGRTPHPRSGIPYMKGRAGELHPNWKGGHTPERQALYSSQEWVDAVKEVWKRANAKCERCGVHHNTRKRRGTFHVHHIVSFTVRELRSTVENLVLLCKECHMFVHSKANVNREWIMKP